MLRNARLLSALLFASWTLVACGLPAARYALTRTTHETSPALPPDCPIELFTSRPDRPFVELGVLDHDRETQAARDAGGFLRVARAPACAAGGNAILTEINGYGSYVRGTVIRWGGAPATSGGAGTPAAPSGAAPPQAKVR